MATNRRLHQLREQLQANREINRQKNYGSLAEDVLPWEEDGETAVSIIANLPPHLGWESGPASLVIRAALRKYHPVPHTVKDAQLRADHPSFRCMSDESYPGVYCLVTSSPQKIG